MSQRVARAAIGRTLNVRRWIKMKEKLDSMEAERRKCANRVGFLNHEIYALSVQLGQVAKRIIAEGSPRPWMEEQ